MSNEVMAGRYELGPLIGRGATARVHRAVDRELGRAVAVKVYDSHVVAVEQLRRAREKTLLASVQHPGIVAVFDSGTEADRPFLVMQLVEGENLAERLCAAPFTAAEVRELAVRLAEALAHVHARNIVHRDLKPTNVLLGPDGPVLTDFGTAHALDATRITGTGLVTGTAAYLAPEQILGEAAGPSADIYALGLILLECLTAQLEFPGTLAESATARLHRGAADSGGNTGGARGCAGPDDGAGAWGPTERGGGRTVAGWGRGRDNRVAAERGRGATRRSGDRPAACGGRGRWSGERGRGGRGRRGAHQAGRRRDHAGALARGRAAHQLRRGSLFGHAGAAVGRGDGFVAGGGGRGRRGPPEAGSGQARP
ncbi:serine/threonine-protein kinase [Amycolatopsis sp. cmx-8-4]|uniref:serine/threonine-protein kinase n=1 Tax=Amycolatopsis sp. cmx-8-4 TaxID=2790947 RepID=UPI00397ACCF1